MQNFLSAAIGVTWELPFEIPFIQWLQSLGGEGSFLFYLMNFISMCGEEVILVAILGLIYWGIDKTRGEKISFMMISATLLNPMIKNIACRTRPFDAHPYDAATGEGVKNLRNVDGYSFPSGHSSQSTSVFLGTAVTYRDKHKWLLISGIIVPILVALSRNYLGAHYPTDVVAGLALGVLIVFGVHLLYKVVHNKYVLYCAMAIIGLAGMFYCKTTDYFTAYGLMLGFLFGVMFEEKVVHFKNTKTWWRILLRVAVGGGLYFGINTALKAVVGAIFPEYDANFWFSSIFRTVRYAVIGFVLFGVYPLLFAPMEKLWKKLHWLKDENVNCADGTDMAEISDSADCADNDNSASANQSEQP